MSNSERLTASWLLKVIAKIRHSPLLTQNKVASETTEMNPASEMISVCKSPGLNTHSDLGFTL